MVARNEFEAFVNLKTPLLPPAFMLTKIVDVATPPLISPDKVAVVALVPQKLVVIDAVEEIWMLFSIVRAPLKNNADMLAVLANTTFPVPRALLLPKTMEPEAALPLAGPALIVTPEKPFAPFKVRLPVPFFASVPEIDPPLNVQLPLLAPTVVLDGATPPVTTVTDSPVAVLNNAALPLAKATPPVQLFEVVFHSLFALATSHVTVWACACPSTRVSTAALSDEKMCFAFMMF